jgi:hypothetical protein
MLFLGVMLRWLFIELALLACATSLRAQITVFPIATSTDVEFSYNPIAFDGTNYLVGFQSPANTIGVQLISPSGSPLGAPILINTGGTGSGPIVAFDGTRYLIAWSTTPSDFMYGQFIGRNGQLAGSVFPISQSPPSYQNIRQLLYVGTNYLVLWRDGRNNYTNGGGDFYGRLMTTAGAFPGSEFPISSPQNDGKDVMAASDGTNCLVAWQSNTGTNNTYGAFISPGGSVGSDFQISQTSSPSQNPVAIAFDGTNYLVVWNKDIGRGPPSAPIWSLDGRLVTRTGTFVGNELVLDTNQTSYPWLAFDGANYLLDYGYDLGATNLDQMLLYRFLDRSANLVGSEFRVFAPQGTNAPLIGPVFFDGKRFLCVGTLGALQGASFKFNNLLSASVYGAFIPASTTPPTLAQTGPLVATQFPLQLIGTPGINYAIQFTTNLASHNWTALVTNSPTNGPFGFIDTSATNKARFYRGVKQ